MAVAKVIEVISSSTESIEHAIRDGVAKCGETVDNIESVWVKDTKGVVRDNGGHAVAMAWSFANVYGMGPDDTWWAASDVGWVVGHSYIV